MSREYSDYKLINRKIQEFILDRFNYYTKIELNKKDISIDCFPKIFVKETIDRTVFELVLYMFGKKQEKYITLKTPKTWFNWQKMKYRKSKWMKWIINRYPIKYKFHEFTLNKHTTFPDLNLPKDFEKKEKIIYYNYEQL